jgi:2-polyprenyl-6-methoxyphenol hydroxylase-like FAD-dependent oxidoreductase
MNTNGSSHRHDVVVVGARAAGSATALLLARLGHDVVVVDRSHLPSDTLSTHAISRSGTVQLARWGLLDDVLASGAPAIREVVFHIRGEAVRREVRDRGGVDHVIAPRRHVLDTILADAASDAGADVRFGVTVDDVRRRPDGRVAGITGRDEAGAPVEVLGRFVVGADGVRSRVARSVGAPVVEGGPSPSGTHYAYFAGPAWPGNEFYVQEGAFAGIFPTNDGEACIWVCNPADEAEAVRRSSPSVDAAFETLLATRAPALAERLRHEGAVRTSPVRSAMRLPNHVRRGAGDGWALVGDAGYHRDPITGHGISDAFRDAELLAVALDGALRDEVDAASALASYEAERDAALREIFDLTVELSAYPPHDEFVERFRRLSKAIDAEALALAARPVPGAPVRAVA